MSASTTVVTSAIENHNDIILQGNTSAGSTNQASLLIHGAAGFGTAGHLTGHVGLSGNSLIAFDSGTLTTIDAASTLTLDGLQARITSGTTTTYTNLFRDPLSILGGLSLENGAGANIDADVTIGSSTAGGGLGLDEVGGAGGTFLEVGGSVASLGPSTIKLGNSSLSGSTTLLVDGRFTASTGTSIVITGGGAGGPAATLNVGSQASPGAGFEAGFGTAGHLTGQLVLSGNALILFQTGQITTIDSGSKLVLDGAQANVGYAAGDGNAALRGLASVDGSLELGDHNALTTSGDLHANILFVDRDRAGGSRLTVGGALDVFELQIGSDNRDLQASTVVRATSLSVALGGIVDIEGNQILGSANRASLIIDSAAGIGTDGVLSGNVSLVGAASLQFASGGFGAIGSFGNLTLSGEDADVAIAGHLGTNSALSGLARNDGDLKLDDGATVRTSGVGLNSTSNIKVDSSFSRGGSTLSIGGTLSNSGSILLGNTGLTKTTRIDAAALQNLGGSIAISGSSFFGGTGQALLTIDGGGTDSGTISLSGNALFKVGADFLDTGTLSLGGSTIEIGGGIFDVANHFSGQGLFELDAGATLRFRENVTSLDGSVVQFNGPNATLLLDARQDPLIAGFAATDKIGLAGFAATTVSYTGRFIDLATNDGQSFGLSVDGTINGIAGKSDGAGGTTVTGIAHAYALTGDTDLISLLRGTNTISATTTTLNAADKLNGSSGADTLALSGGGSFNLGALAAFTGFETVTVAAGANATIIAGDGDVAAGATLTVDASALGASNTLTFNGAAEKDGRFVVRGGAGGDTITGGAGNDVISGGAGTDTMAGGLGDDTYYVDNYHDRVIEAGNGGTDTVRTSATYSIAGQNIEALVLAGTAAISGTGNGLANIITGNGAANVINGGTGADQMTGGGGNDTYYVDNVGDKVFEANGGGTDSVHSTVSFSLGGQYAERLYLDGTTAVDGTGNALANIIRGNSAANTINAGAGNDTLTGGGGADTFVYHANWANDAITDFTAGSAAGHDLVQIDHSLFSDFNDLMAHTTDAGGGAVITLNSANSITLQNVAKASLVSADFKFV